MTPRSWIVVDLAVPDSLQDLLVGQIAGIGFEGFEQRGDLLICSIRSSRWKKSLSQALTQLLARFHREFPASPTTFRLHRVRERNWNKEWERHAGVVRVTNSIVIKPSWATLSPKDRSALVLHIDPKMSFGTGHHETTRLSLQMLQESMFAGASVLDFGTGTGVLAIAAAKLRAAHVDAVDNDEWSIDNAGENIRRNRVHRTVTFHAGSVAAIPRRKYDILVANVDARTFETFLPSLLQRVRPRGVAILSGLLRTDLPSIAGLASRSGFAPVEYATMNEWAAVLFERS